ncbi:uncharacterized protein LOC129921127 [Episyrphus balteatus]|uniref:uncharacterized protein LOC129921127 n=1 Tax=Episyrphus balteatus TaxID=286459 RepID=UPI0024856E41|nr:uncharacterized protein LOC129921127 [Episyrphus balteatus]
MKTMFWIINLPTAGLVVGFITVLISCYNLSELIDELINFDKERSKFIWFMFFSVTEDNIKWEIAIYSMLLISGIFLIIGTIKKLHQLLLPWLIIMVFLILYAVLCTLVLFLLAFTFISFFQNIFLFSAFGYTFLTSLSIYTWIGILTLHCNIHKENQTPTEADVPLYSHPNNNTVVKSSSQQKFNV